MALFHSLFISKVETPSSPSPSPSPSSSPSHPLSLSSLNFPQMSSFNSVNGDLTSSFNGEIHVILGPMFAGKTTELLRRIKSEKTFGRTVAMIKSSKDDRYAIDSVVSHDGVKFPCWALPDLSSFKHNFGVDNYDKLDVIGIDEAQFFEDLYEFCRNAADNDGKVVILAGLDGDYLRRTFGPVLEIIPIADTVTKLTARCEFCGKKAFFTLRKTGDTRTELIGGAESYMPVCRHHYVKGQAVMNTIESRTVIECTKVVNGSSLEAMA